MATASKAKQISVSMEDKLGLLADITGALAAAKVNITAICAWGMENQSTFMMVTDGNAKAKKALQPLGGKIEEDDVVVVEMPDRPGELGKAANKVKEAGVAIWYLYAAAGSKTRSICVLKTEDDKKAIK
ncbi:MAG: ACT domain-containing protein, partial [Nitrospirota bacterium]